MLTVGWHTRIMAVLFYVMMLSIHQANLLTTSGADSLLMIMTFLLMFCPSGAAYSFDARRAAKRRGTPAEPLVLPWGLRLIQIQLCLIYFDTAVLKSNGATWLNGTALHYVLLNTEVGRPLFGWLTGYPLIINVMTHGAILIEFALAFLLCSGPRGDRSRVAGVGLHTAIWLTINIPIFGEIMVVCYLLFLAPDEVQALIRFFNPMTWLRKTRATLPAADSTRAASIRLRRWRSALASDLSGSRRSGDALRGMISSIASHPALSERTGRPRPRCRSTSVEIDTPFPGELP